MAKIKENSKEWKNKQPKFDENGVPLFNPNEYRCPITGYGCDTTFVKSRPIVQTIKVGFFNG